MGKRILGVDIGGVIIDRVNDNTDTSFFRDKYLETTAVPGAFDSLARLANNSFKDSIYLISKCGLDIQRKTRAWLEHHRFYEITGIKRENLRFCSKRNEKADICKELGVTHFVDDRLEVLSYLIGEVEWLYLFRQSDRGRDWDKYLSYVKPLEEWSALTDTIERDV